MDSQSYSELLRSLMHAVGLSSFKALGQAAGVSRWQVEQLRQGKAAQMRTQPLYQLSQTLGVSLSELVRQFSQLPVDSIAAISTQADSVADSVTELKQEYQRLQTQLEQQRAALTQEFQQACLQILESWLLQFPTAAYAAQQNPQMPAVKLLPLMHPIDRLLADWGVESIAPIGAEVAYDPQRHQLMEGTAQPGALVKVRYAGYCYGEKLLHRAKVSPI